MIRNFISLIVLTIMVCIAPVSFADEKPIKALFILGGEHHQYEKCSKIIVDFLASNMDIEVDFVRIDNPPEGMPRAEKATVKSNPSILESPDLNKKYDLIMAYNQESYTNLTPKQLDGYLHYVRAGGSFVGIHSAADFMKSSPDYVRMIGGKFETHPPFCKLDIQRIEGRHFILEGLSDFTIKDEFYHVSDCSLEDKQILLVGKSPKANKTRPVAWTKKYGQGKVFYTVLGHAPESVKDPNFQKLIHRAVLWALKTEVGQKDKDGFINLFNGADLTGWTHCGPGSVIVEDGALKTVGGMGLLWFDLRSFADFTLSIEYKIGRKQDNSGIFVRFPNPPKDQWAPVSTGYEIQICDAAESKHATGSIYNFKGPKEIPSKPVNEWNHFEISVKGQNYTVCLNGKKINEYVGERGLDGYIGIQNHDSKSIVHYRNIKIKEH